MASTLPAAAAVAVASPSTAAVSGRPKFSLSAFVAAKPFSLAFALKPPQPLLSRGAARFVLPVLASPLRNAAETAAPEEDLGWGEEDDEEDPQATEPAADWEDEEEEDVGAEVASAETDEEGDWVDEEEAKEAAGGEKGDVDPNLWGGLGAEEEFYEPPEDAKLYVGNLPFTVDSEQLAELFNQAGVVEIAEVIYNRGTDQSRGFGFVTMRTVEEAQKAVEMFHRFDYGGRTLTVGKASPRGNSGERPPRTPRESTGSSFRMYVGNLPWQVDDSRLEQVFSEHGKVLEARVVYDRASGRSRGFGFVSMSSQEEVDDAIAALDGQTLEGRPLRVNIAEERSPRSF